MYSSVTTIFRLIVILCVGALVGCANIQYRAGDTVVTQVNTIKNQARPSVVLVHGCGGPGPNQHWMPILDNAGFNAILVDYIHYRGYNSVCDGNIPFSINNTISDLDEIIGWVKNQDWHTGGISVMGFSLGGGIVNSFTDLDSLKAKGIIVKEISKLSSIISIYPLCGVGPLASTTKIPTQLHFGLNDFWTHHSYCMTDRLDKINYELVYYENAMHGFDIPGTPTHVNGIYRLQYNPEAYQQIQKNVIRFLKIHL